MRAARCACAGRSPAPRPHFFFVLPRTARPWVVPPCTACRLRMLDSWKGTLLWRASWCICAAGPALSVRAPPR